MISIYCSERLDGIASAAIILRHALLAKLPAQFGGMLHPENIEEELEALSKLQGKLIFLLDLPLSPAQAMVLEETQGRNKLVYWTTSDPGSTIPPARLIDPAKENECCARAAQTRFLPNDPIARQLAQMAHAVKFWEDDGQGRKLAELAAAGYPLQDLIEQLSRGVFWNDRFDSFYHKYEEKKKGACEEMMRSLVLKKYLNVNIGFAFCPVSIATAEAGECVLKSHSGVDIAAVLYRDGRFVLRRRDSCNVDVCELAAIFGGGGKVHASGGHIAGMINKDNLPEIVFQFDSAFKNYFVSRNAI